MIKKKMNREKADKLFKVYKTGPIKLKNGKQIQFARQTPKVVEEIEAYSDKELVESWKSLVFINHIYGLVCLGEMQKIDLLELEMEERPNIQPKELKDWFDNQMKKQEESEKIEIEKYENEHRKKD